MKNNKKTILQKLDRKFFKDFSFFEVILFTVGTIVGCTVFIVMYFCTKNNSQINNTKLYVSYFLTLIDIPIGVVAATRLSQKDKYAPLLLTFDAFLYGASNFLVGNYALGVVNAILTPMLWLMAFFYFWKNNQEKNNKKVKTNKLSLSTGIPLAIILILIAVGFGYAIPSFTSTKKVNDFTVWFDSFSGTLMLGAVILGVFRFRETWYLYLTANVLKIILFVATIIMGQQGNVMLLIMSSVYFTNTIFGLLIWQSSKKVTFKLKS